MTAISGLVGPHPSDQLASHCSRILDGLQPYGRGIPVVKTAQGAAFGIALYDLLPEDSQERPPLVSNDRFLLVADVRLDNREALAADAGLRERLSQATDAEILLAAWSRAGDRCLDKLVGDFAIAVFDKRDHTLVLARDATGQRPLFYAASTDSVAFASMPSGLLSDPEFNRGWDMRRTASLLELIRMNEPETYFAGVSRVLPGEVVTFSRGRPSRRFHWNPLGAEAVAMSFEEAIEEYRHVLTSAVRCRLRRRSGFDAAHLSSGYDSSSIAATAAIAEGPGQVLAYTAVPSGDFLGSIPSNRVGDESAVAAITASRYGLKHRIVHSTDFTLDYLRRQARLYQEPLRNIINSLWADEIRKVAAGDDATVLLNGMGGNMTLNAGGPYYLSEWLRQRGFGEWWRQAKAVARREDKRWRSTIFTSFAPSLPRSLWWTIWRLFRRRQALPLTFVRREWKLSAAELPERGFGQASRSTAEDRVNFARTMDPGVHHKGGLADSGVWELEPLTDRRAVEFGIALTPEQLIRDGEFRPVARAALRDLLPREVLDARRGVQSADWEEHFTRRGSFEILEEIATSNTARSLLDLDAIRRAIETWPPRGRAEEHEVTTYTIQLPIALTTGIFLKETEEGWRRSRG